MNTLGEIELNIKKIVENLKHVSPTTVDLSYYHGGMPCEKAPTLSNMMGLDPSEMKQFEEDKNPDVSKDKDDVDVC